MGDAENTSTKKRAAGRELSRDNPGLDDEDVSEQETGTFKRASDDVLASRRIVKVRRGQAVSAPSSNPFAGIRLVPPIEKSGSASEVKVDAQAVGEKIGSVQADGKDVSHEETKKDGDHNEEIAESKVGTSEVGSAPNVLNVDQNSTAASESTIPKVDDNIVAKSNKNEHEEPAGEDKVDNAELVRDDKAENDVCVSGSENEDPARNGENENVDPARDKNENEDPSEGNAIQNKETGDEETTKNEEKKEDESEAEPSKEAAPLNSFQQLSSNQNAFTGLAGTGFSTSTFSFGNIPKDGLGLSASFGLSTNGSSALFGTSGSSSIASKSEKIGFPSMQEVAVETGEENERVVFNSGSILFEFIDGSWKERGKGELKVNIPTSRTGRARILMRARGNYRLILNASLYPDMKLTNMDKKGITFACVNSTSDRKDDVLSTFALKFKDASIVEDFRSAVTEHKGYRKDRVIGSAFHKPLRSRVNESS